MNRASGSAASWTMLVASSTSSRPMLVEPVTLTRMPLAPLMVVSSRGLEMARWAASWAFRWPAARPMPMWARPASFMTAVTSAKSMLMKPVLLMMSEMAWTAWRSTSSAISKALDRVIFRSDTYFSRSLGMMTRESTLPSSSSMPASACSIRRRPSKEKGLVTTPTVRMPISRAMVARMGAAPVPVPPPMPAVMNRMSAPRISLASCTRLSSAERRPISGSEPAPWPAVTPAPIWTLWSAVEALSACRSVFTAMNSTPLAPRAIIWLTTLLPPPPTPTTRISTMGSMPFSTPKLIFSPPDQR